MSNANNNILMMKLCLATAGSPTSARRAIVKRYQAIILPRPPTCCRRCERRRRRRPHATVLMVLSWLVSAASTSFFLFGVTRTCILININSFCHANEYSSADENANDDDVDDGDFLAEILAEQAREEEELARAEAEVREFETIKARQTTMGGGGGMPDDNGGPRIGKMGGSASHTMPKKGPGGRGSRFSKIEDDLTKKEAENARRKQTQEEEIASQEAERTRLRREAAFEEELQRMNNEEQRKKAKRQKARDAKVVKRILKAHEAGRHYAVLGVRNLEFQLGPIYILDNFMIGPITLFRTKTNDIKRAYRNLARAVHPDKNKDGRAEEAFHALETSAAILTDEKQRSDYDKRIIAMRRRRNKHAIESVLGVSQVAWTKTILTLRMAKRILGPFSTPILVVGSMII